MRFLANLLDIPWWGAFALVVGAGVFFFCLYGVWFRWKFEKIVHDAVIEAGTALKDAQVTVHSVKATERPTGPSPYDVHEDDDEFMEGVDGEPWDDEGHNFFTIEATIEPADADALWDPTGLAMVPADYTPDDAAEISEDLCGMHSAEVFENGRWQAAPEKEVRGPRKLRMLFAVREGMREAKFANLVTYFGHVDLPAPLAKTARAPGS